MNVFLPADILLPDIDNMEKWAVIACDQFTSDRKYWERVRTHADGSPSTINLILPEAILGTSMEAEQTDMINSTMREYLESGIFTEYKNSYVYVERTLENGAVRKGLVGMVDLEAYDFAVGNDKAIRATEGTVLERIPPRSRVRRDALIELPHIIMLCDDHEKCLIEPITSNKDRYTKLYDFELMEGGGHIAGWIVSGADVETFNDAFSKYVESVPSKYEGLSGIPMVLATGDGNHSLATAKACYEKLKEEHPGVDLSDHPARYCLVELENIHDEAQVFEPIHRIVKNCDTSALIEAVVNDICTENGSESISDESFSVQVYCRGAVRNIIFDSSKGELAVGILQNWLDSYLSSHTGEIDYIHDDDALIDLAKEEGSVGFLLPPMEKSQLFRGVISDGVLPRKTFSMGHSREKRYYIEARKIK